MLHLKITLHVGHVYKKLTIAEDLDIVMLIKLMCNLLIP